MNSNITKEQIENLFLSCTGKIDLARKLGISLNQNGYNIDQDLLLYLSEIGFSSRESITKINFNKDLDKRKSEIYYKNPQKCLNCGNIVTWERYKQKSKFCCRKCATGYGNKHRGSLSEETRNKISNSIKNNYRNGYINPNAGRICNKVNEANPEYIFNLQKLVDDGLVINRHNCEIISTKMVYLPKNRLYKCPICGKELYGIIKPNTNKVVRINTCGDPECTHKLRQVSNREQQQKLIAEGKHKGWQSRNITSYAEKFWIKVLDNNNIKYKREYVFKVNEHRYFLDFYIEINGRKIDLEIDGKQHTYEDRIESDKIRDKLITKSGIEVYRIPWNEIKTEEGSNMMKNKIDSFLKYLNNNL